MERRFARLALFKADFGSFFVVDDLVQVWDTLLRCLFSEAVVLPRECGMKWFPLGL
jgi:hypothetical protein